MTDQGAYPLEPIEPAKPAAPVGSVPSAPAPKPGSAAPNASLNAPGLLADFDEDADFSEPAPIDPRAGERRSPDVTSLLPPIVTDASIIPVLGNPKILGVIGGVLLLLAVIITGVCTTSTRPLIQSLITLYEGLVHTGTGVVAVLVAARFAERRVNRVDLIAPRVLVLVALFLGVYNLNIPIPTKLEEFLLACGIYYLGLLLVFRLPRFELGLISGTHFCLFVLMKLGSLMYEVSKAAPTVAPHPPG